MATTFIRGHCCADFIFNMSVDLDEIYYAATMFWFAEVYAEVISHVQYSTKKFLFRSIC